MNEIQEFVNVELGANIRVVDLDGDPWFVAADIAKVLGYRDARDAVRGLDDDEKGTHLMRTPGGSQKMIVVSESGLYNLCLRSERPEAKPLRRWVTREVLPSIRRHGAYITPVVAGQLRDDPTSITALLDRLVSAEVRLAEIGKFAPRVAQGAISHATGLPRVIPRRGTYASPPRQAYIIDGGLFIRQDDESD